MRPRDGAVTRVRIFRSVDLPAPLRPTIPSASPWGTSKETSSSASNSVYFCLPVDRIHWTAAAAAVDGRSPKAPSR